MRFERGTPADFFKRSPDADTILAERKRWLANKPETCTAITINGAPLLEEVIGLAAEWKTLPSGCDFRPVLKLPAIEQCRWLCECWETDFLVLKPDQEGTFRLQGGALCFPSHWDLHSKMNRSVWEIHEPVPGLNTALGKSIDGFLARIRPGISWERHNWGLSCSAELNQHPARKLPRLDESVTLDQVWWRLEDQSLVALPQSGGVLFGIRVTVHPLSEVKAHPSARTGLLQALDTMPDEMAVYKGIANARGRIQELLKQ